MRTMACLCALGLAMLGCGKGDKGGGDRGKAAPPPAAACPPGDQKGPIAWYEDDYATALACARATSRPLVIDLWAPWCHTCLSMSATVLVDPSLAPLADRFVWLALDTDREKNAAAVGRFALQNWPTYFVIDPRTEAIAARWLGAASAAQFRQFLKDGETTAMVAPGAAVDPLLAAMREGDVAATRKDWAAARTAYQRALAQAPADWARTSDVLVALISATHKAGDVAGCLGLAVASSDKLGTTANATDFFAWALTCAGDDAAEPAAATQVRERAVATLGALADRADAPLSIDDRSDLLLNLREAQVALGRADDATATAARQVALLDDAAAKAPTPAVAMTYNWQRAEVYVFLGKGAQITGALEKSAADLPEEYDPPYRLAWVYLKIGDATRAKQWAEVALGKAYGPRKVRVANLVIEAAKALGDRAAERAARQALVAVLEGLPKDVAQPENLDKARRELAAMETGAGSGAGSGSGSGSASVSGSGSGSGSASGSGSGSGR